MFDLFLSTWPEVFPLTSTFAAFKAALVIIYTQDSLVLFRHVCMLQICLHNAHELLVLDIVLEERHCASLHLEERHCALLRAGEEAVFCLKTKLHNYELATIQT